MHKKLACHPWGSPQPRTCRPPPSSSSRPKQQYSGSRMSAARSGTWSGPRDASRSNIRQGPWVMWCGQIRHAARSGTWAGHLGHELRPDQAPGQGSGYSHRRVLPLFLAATSGPEAPPHENEREKVTVINRFFHARTCSNRGYCARYPVRGRGPAAAAAAAAAGSGEQPSAASSPAAAAASTGVQASAASSAAGPLAAAPAPRFGAAVFAAGAKAPASASAPPAAPAWPEGAARGPGPGGPPWLPAWAHVAACGGAARGACRAVTGAATWAAMNSARVMMDCPQPSAR
jgi:hypothetical protein